MKQSFLFGLAFMVCFGRVVRAASEGPGDRAVEVRALFRTHCAGCHGPEVARPAGRFGYVLDLKRVAANPELVIPGKPNESELFNLIRTDQMPPPNARNKLNGEQKETVRAWILAGAPPLSPDAEDSAGTAAGDPSSGDVRRVLADAGRFHLLVLHFPIAFLLAAAVVDLWASGRKQTVPSPIVRFCLVFGAVTAVVAAGLGWCYAAVGHGASVPETLFWHRWLGTAVACWSVFAALVMERDVRRGKRGSLGQLTAISAAALVGVAAHFGGELVHGSLFTTW
jgi:mono/diheme cytochrome c family protein